MKQKIKALHNVMQNSQGLEDSRGPFEECWDLPAAEEHDKWGGPLVAQ